MDDDSDTQEGLHLKGISDEILSTLRTENDLIGNWKRDINGEDALPLKILNNGLFIVG